MKLPRDVAGTDLVKALCRIGYVVERQRGSHVTLTTLRNGVHHVTVPLHHALRVGTFGSILAAIALHLGISREVLLDELKL